jgi:signal transduction histidine kinase
MPVGTSVPNPRPTTLGPANLDRDSLDTLRRIPLFSDLTGEDLLRLAGLAKRVFLPAGSVLMEEGTPGDQFYVILNGELEVTRQEGGRTALLDVLGPGGFLSEMSLLEDRPRSASARAIGDSELLAIEPDEFRGLMATSPGAALAMLKTVTARLRSTESTLIEHGRMAGLGTLAAGLAHELNNPAAAMARGTSLLGEAMMEWQKRCTVLEGLHLTQGEADLILEMEGSLLQTASSSSPPLPRSGKAERELEAWLQEQGITENWDMAPVLAESGWDRARAEDLQKRLTPNHLEPILRWAVAGMEAFGLVDGVRRAAKAISEIVASVRSYSSVDSGPVQKVDVRESLSNALVIMRGRLEGGVTLIEKLPPDLPNIEARGGELGQVWTNLIHNALDAMGGAGTLEIRGWESEEGVVVEIVDSGPGIPPEIRPRIFDPFFTTKPEGSGTGLGLAITYGIVVNQHRGSIRVDSRPGRTVFEVALPFCLPREPTES